MKRAIFISIALLIAASAVWFALCDTNPVSEARTGSRGSNASQADDVAREASRNMAQQLRDIAHDTPDQNPFLGSGRARALRAQLAKLPTTARPRVVIATLVELGDRELDLGNVARALALFRRANQLDGQRRVLDEHDRTELLYRLGLAWLQMGEDQNCCMSSGPESCILPLQGAGIHQHREGSTRAAEYFRQVATRAPLGSQRHRAAAWLLNAAHMTLGTWPERVAKRFRIPAAALQSKIPFRRFSNVASEQGLDNLSVAGGIAVEDFDGDGDLDILTSAWDPVRRMHAYRNTGGGTFQDVSTDSGLEGQLGGINLRTADYDNDGDLDVLVLRGAWLANTGQHPNSLLQNDGHGRFTDVSVQAGIASPAFPTQTAEFADFDGDGDLDLYVGNETTDSLQAPSQLFRNNGNGTFTDVAKQAGVENLRTAKGVSWGDYDNDGDPDLYVSNLQGDNRLYRNEGDGTFTDVAPTLNVTKPHTSFPTWFWDYNNDGALDLFVPYAYGSAADAYAHYRNLPLTTEANRLYAGDGKGGFRDVATDVGFTYPACPMGSNYGDLDGDGLLDFYLGTGNPLYETLVPNLLFVNRGGERFHDVTFASGLGHLQKGHATAFADFDDDGDIDVLAQLGGAVPGDLARDAVFRNPGFEHPWVRLRLRGTASNRSAIGARIHVRLDTPDGPRSLYRHVSNGGSFGTNPLRKTIGLGNATRIAWIEVQWPGYATERFQGAQLNTGYVVVEGSGTLERAAGSQGGAH